MAAKNTERVKRATSDKRRTMVKRVRKEARGHFQPQNSGQLEIIANGRKGRNKCDELKKSLKKNSGTK